MEHFALICKEQGMWIVCLMIVRFADHTISAPTEKGEAANERNSFPWKAD